MDEIVPLAVKMAPVVSSLIERMGITHVLDYWCGETVELAKALKVKEKITYQAYDPNVPRYSKDALPAQLVCCIGVLGGGMEPVGIIDNIAGLCEGCVFLTAKGNFKDWLPKLWDKFDIQTAQIIDEDEIMVIGTAKPRLEKANGQLLV